MTRSDLAWQIILSTVIEIFGLGALVGGGYSLALLVFMTGDALVRGDAQGAGVNLIGFAPASAIGGGILGATVGLILSVPIGLLISVITVLFFVPLRDESRYLRVVQWSSMLLGSVGAFVCIPVVLGTFVDFLDFLGDGRSSSWSFPTTIGAWVVFGIIPALLAGVAIRSASRQVSRWYVLDASSYFGDSSPNEKAP